MLLNSCDCFVVASWLKIMCTSACFIFSGNHVVQCSVSEISDQDKGNDEDSEDSSAPALLAAVRFATSSSAEGLEYFGWGEVVHSNRSRCVELMAAKLMPTSSPIVHLTVS